MELTIADLAQAVGKDQNYVRQHIRRQNLVARREGRRVLVDESEAARWAKERGLPFSQAMTTLWLDDDDQVGERAARVTVLALRTTDGTVTNMFTLVRHRDRNSLGPWINAENPSWQREIIGVENSDQIGNLELYRLDTTFPECQAIVEQILQNDALMIGDDEIRYTLERNPRRHWAYREHTKDDAGLPESRFGKHSSEMTEYWCFDPETQERWLETLKVAGEAANQAAKTLHFPLARRVDRVGNLMIASAQDAIETEITAKNGRSLILRVRGDDWTTPPLGAYSATVWAGHSGDRVVQRSIDISEPETEIDCETDIDLVGFAIYRNSDGQCIDQYEAHLIMSIEMDFVIGGPEVRMNIKTPRKSINVGTTLGTARETIKVEGNGKSEVDQAIRAKNLSYRAWEKDQAARGAGDPVKFAPERVGEAINHITDLIREQSRSDGPVYFADPYFLGDKVSDVEIELLASLLSATRGRPLHILCGRRSKALRLEFPRPLTVQATVKRFIRPGDGRPAFHDRYLITPAGETLITNSVNGWEKQGVTFSTRSHGVYRAEAEKLWLTTVGANGNDVLVTEANPW